MDRCTGAIAIISNSASSVPRSARWAPRRCQCTVNGLERVNGELHRRTRVATLFPNEDSLLRLVSALAAEISGEWETARAYLAPRDESPDTSHTRPSHQPGGHPPRENTQIPRNPDRNSGRRRIGRPSAATEKRLLDRAKAPGSSVVSSLRRWPSLARISVGATIEAPHRLAAFPHLPAATATSAVAPQWARSPRVWQTES
ncbi:MAG: hypothetical protein FJ108_11270 [Deltaproteobacteria bacterium]|nr:hypothetical protein [Deltaproteobacteria bacterium]